jgi:hypothetical protein
VPLALAQSPLDRTVFGRADVFRQPWSLTILEPNPGHRMLAVLELTADTLSPLRMKRLDRFALRELSISKVEVTDGKVLISPIFCR